MDLSSLALDDEPRLREAITQQVEAAAADGPLPSPSTPEEAMKRARAQYSDILRQHTCYDLIPRVSSC